MHMITVEKIPVVSLVWRDGLFCLLSVVLLVHCGFEMHFNRFIITDVMIQVENGVIRDGQDARVNLIVVPLH